MNSPIRPLDARRKGSILLKWADWPLFNLFRLTRSLIPRRQERKSAVLGWFSTCTIALTLFAIDILANPQVSVIALYAALIVASARKSGPRALLLIGVATGGLAILGQLIGPQPDGDVGLLNGIFNLVAIATITWLTIRIEGTRRALSLAHTELARVSRFLLVDEMNTILAHELNQPLGAASANTHAALRWLSASPPNDDEARRALLRIAEAVEYAGTIIHQRRDPACKTIMPSVPVQIAAVVEDACVLVQHQLLTHDVTLSVEDLDGLTVLGNSTHLQQVVINLLMNAIEAVAAVPVPRLVTISGASDTITVKLVISDSGLGIDPSFAPHLFEPFHSTKQNGLGMGLSISRSIVEAYGGSIQVKANMPNGTVFTVKLPAVTTNV